MAWEEQICMYLLAESSINNSELIDEVFPFVLPFWLGMSPAFCRMDEWMDFWKLDDFC